MNDFLITGMGLTPYSRNGFVNVGRRLDGRLSLKRAIYRTACAQRLADLGCRAPLTAAIFKIDGADIRMPDGSHSSPAIMLRAFRSMVRVKQLDPILCTMHSMRHSITALDFMISMAQRSSKNLDELEICKIARAFDHYGPADNDLSNILKDDPIDRPRKIVHGIRLALLRQSARTLITRTINQFRTQSPKHNGMDVIGFSTWFASELGRQLGIFRVARFLHDYHYDGIKRNSNWVYSLIENNVTMACEFADLETGVFVDSPNSEISDGIQLDQNEISYLRNNFNSLHFRDFRAAQKVAETVALIARLITGRTDSYFQEAFLSSYYSVIGVSHAKSDLWLSSRKKSPPGLT